MKKIGLIAVAASAGLAGCQTPTYTQYMAGPPLEYAQAKCNVLAPSVHTGYMAMGTPGFVAGAAIGNALSNAIAEIEFKRNCMAMQGWRQDAPGAQKPMPAAATYRAPDPRVRYVRPRSEYSGVARSIPGRVTAGQ